MCVPYTHLYFCLDCVVQHTLLIFLSYYYTTKNEARFKVEQIKPFSDKRFFTSPDFESEVFCNSQMARSRYITTGKLEHTFKCNFNKSHAKLHVHDKLRSNESSVKY